MASTQYSLDKEDVINLAKNALLVGLSATLTYVGENLSSLDLGSVGIMLVPVVSVLIDTAVKWAKNNTKNK